MEEFVRNVAIVVFTDGKNVVVQERGAVSKVGEKYGFWGGGIENGETPEETIKREIKEEMGFALKNFSYLGSFPYEVKEECLWKGKKINQEVFVAPISEIPKDVKISEGVGVVEMSIEEAEKGIGFPIGSTYFISSSFASFGNKSRNG